MELRTIHILDVIVRSDTPGVNLFIIRGVIMKFKLVVRFELPDGQFSCYDHMVRSIEHYFNESFDLFMDRLDIDRAECELYSCEEVAKS